MKKTRILLFAAGLAMAAFAWDYVGPAFSGETIPMAVYAFAGLTAWAIAPAFDLVARHLKHALAMSLQHPGGRSPSALLIAAKAHAERMFSRKHITVTGSWRMCPSG